MIKLDKQISQFETDLINDVGLHADETSMVASLAFSEIKFLPEEAKNKIELISPVPLSQRLEELKAFQMWSEIVSSQEVHPAVVRAQVIVQSYVCFVYLKDALFEIISSLANEDSVIKKSSAFLSRGKVRDFRNAFSHANWCYKEDFSGFKCWVLKDSRKRNGPMKKFEVSQHEMNFWQTLSRGISYATYEYLCS